MTAAPLQVWECTRGHTTVVSVEARRLALAKPRCDYALRICQDDAGGFRVQRCGARLSRRLR